MIHENRHLLDWLTAALAAVSGTLTVAEVASGVAILAGLASLVLFGIRIYDRFTYGNWNGPVR